MKEHRAIIQTELIVSPVVPISLDLQPLGGSGQIEAYFVSILMRSVDTEDVLGHVRVTLAGMYATQDNVRTAGKEASVVGWQLRKADLVEHDRSLMADAMTYDGARLLAMRGDREIWLMNRDDLRRSNQGVRVALNLRTHDLHAGYLFVHLLTADPQATLNAAQYAARSLWLPDAKNGNGSGDAINH